jgi:hypothetical protein
MNESALDRHLTGLLQRGLGLSEDREDALWSDFTLRAARETAAWAAIAAALAFANRRLQATLPSSVWPGWFLSGV